MTELEEDTNPDDTPTTEEPPQPDEDDQGKLAEQHEGMPPVPDTTEDADEATDESDGE